MSDLGFDLSMSLKVKCNSVIGLTIYALLLMFNSNIWPNSTPLQDIRKSEWLEFEIQVQMR